MGEGEGRGGEGGVGKSTKAEPDHMTGEVGLEEWNQSKVKKKTGAVLHKEKKTSPFTS